MNINLANIDFCPGGGSSEAKLAPTTAEILLTETEKVILPPEGTDGFNKVTITHAPVEESVSATITENGTHTITPSEGFDAMFGVNVDVNIPSVTDDKIQYFDKKPTADDAGLKAIGWDDESVNYFKYNNYAYPWEADKYKVSDANKQIVINSKNDIATYKSNPNFKYCPKFDTSAENDMYNMFNNCNSLTSIPLLDTHSVTNMYNMFNNCNSLTSIPLLDTHSVTNMYNMFNTCNSLTSIPQLNTQNVTNMRFMFYECNSLTSIPQLDTHSVTDMRCMFYDCNSLTSIPQLDTHSVTNMSDMFNKCNSLTSIPQLDTHNVTKVDGMISGCYEVTTLGGFTGLKVGLWLSSCPKLTHDSLMNVINEAGDVTSNPQTLTLGATNLAKLTDDEKAIATGKGWTLK